MKFSNETLMAYADGELDLVTRAEVEAAMVSDPEVHRAVLRHRALAARVKAAYQGVLEEPMPAKLASLAADPVAAPVVELRAERDARRARKAPPGAWGVPQWAAIAASVTLGVMVGVFALRGSGALFEETAAGLIARGELDATLTRQLAGSLGTGAPQVGISFRDRGGAYCRTFHVQQEAPLAGLACRAGDDWRVQVLAAAPAREGDMQPASAMPMAVLQVVDAAIVGEPLDAEAEAAARDAGWQARLDVAE
ncbi:MAG: anti-sigma factor family protein [Gammaproteobacteria bacterium]